MALLANRRGRVVSIPDDRVEEFLKRGFKRVVGGLREPASAPPRDLIPEDFPAFKSLRAAGFRYLDQLTGLTSEDLVSVPGVGPALARRILEAR